jgi:TorA maturation chaperone TorD
MTPADRLAIYLEVAAALRATGERGSEVAALLVEQLADELGEAVP